MLISDWSSDVCSSDLLVPGQVLAYRDRHEAALARHLAQYPLVVVLVQLDELRQRVQHPLDVAGVLAHHHDAELLAVGGERQAEAVEDEPARRRPQAPVDALFLGPVLVAGGLPPPP